MIHHGDCVEVMAAMPADSVDAIVCDPPYGLSFMGKEWDSFGGVAAHQGGESEGRATYNDVPRTVVSGYMQKGRRGLSIDESAKANRPMQEWHHRWATAAFRVAKPGAYLLAFGGTRTFHRLACAIEDAGWIIRDTLVWGYASGFPKSKATLKPAWEPIVMARKPGPLRELAIDACRIGTTKDVPASPSDRFGANGIYNTGLPALAERDGMDPNVGRWPANIVLTPHELTVSPEDLPPGVSPAGAIFDGGIEGVVGGGETGAGVYPSQRGAPVVTTFAGPEAERGEMRASDTGTYSRFFLIAKAARADREPNDYGKLVGGLANGAEHGTSYQTKVRECAVCGDRTKPPGPNVEWPACGHDDWAWVDVIPKQRANVHPTVKPTELMRHLVRLVTPTGGVCLDPFLGSGTTALACEMEGFQWIGIEREAEYVAIAEARLAGVQRGLGLDVPAPTPKATESHPATYRNDSENVGYGGLPSRKAGTTVGYPDEVKAKPTCAHKWDILAYTIEGMPEYTCSVCGAGDIREFMSAIGPEDDAA